MRAVFVTADDYGYNPAVDAAIRDLLQAGRLSGTGCMTRSPRWQDAAQQARSLLDEGPFGLHVDLTEFSPLRRGLWPLIAASLCRRLDDAALRDEIDHQCALFEDATGHAPAYVDGHQHVHQLPQVRDALLDVLTRRYAGRLPWLRISGARPGDGSKSLFIAALGAPALERRATAAGFRVMPRLLGAYGFDGDTAGYRRRLAAWLSGAADGDALMVHPASAALPDDPIGEARVREYAVLREDLPAVMAAAGVGLARFDTDTHGRRCKT
jgi:predicted glycoside hydrolase/deacetylase ChbG (UPF0249 family)